MTEPLRLEFTVRCSPEHAFEMWATQASLWWPHDHSVSADPGITVTYEPRVGGRIYERTPAGVEHDWGEVLTWEPPTRITYLWHLARDRSDATEVEVTFSSEGDGTIVTIEHRGWERFGAAGPDLRERNRRGWSGVIPHYEVACAGA
jgi:uncharacterized protein YndB with AHSA1/START domain